MIGWTYPSLIEHDTVFAVPSSRSTYIVSLWCVNNYFFLFMKSFLEFFTGFFVWINYISLSESPKYARNWDMVWEILLDMQMTPKPTTENLLARGSGELASPLGPHPEFAKHSLSKTLTTF